MGVVPERASPIGHEAVGELTADRHGILSQTGDAVHSVGDVDPVPVQRDSCSNRLVTEVNLHQLALANPDLGAGRCAIDRESGN